VAPDLLAVKTSLQALADTSTTLVNTVNVLASEVRAIGAAATAVDEPMGVVESAFSGKVRHAIYTHMCEDGFFPSINQVMSELLEHNERLEYAVIALADGPEEDESLIRWEKRKKKTHKKLQKKVS
jgi:hypothetical protein